MQRCLASLIVWKDQLLQQCVDHESALKQYCMEMDAAIAQQEQRLLGQAANNLQQRDAALTALHQVEDEVVQLKLVIQVRLISCSVLVYGQGCWSKLSTLCCSAMHPGPAAVVVWLRNSKLHYMHDGINAILSQVLCQTVAMHRHGVRECALCAQRAGCLAAYVCLLLLLFRMLWPLQEQHPCCHTEESEDGAHLDLRSWAEFLSQ